MTTDTVATTIFKQLGKPFAFMTGARNFVAHPDALSFRLPSTMTKDRISYVKITLAADDTYTLNALNIRGTKIKPIAKVEGVYADRLRATFREMTGMAVSL